MKILFITSDYPSPEKGANLYTDLASALKENNHDIRVVVAEEKKKIAKTKLFKENGIPVLRVRIGNLYETSLLEKGITFLTLSRALKKSIKTYFDNAEFDLILFQSPPLTMCSVVKWAMKKYKARSYLMMKDIFPQNGVDIGIYSKKSPIYWFFRRKEKKLYKISSKIGCMSKGNMEYLLEHNKYLKSSKLEIFPNTVKINERVELTEKEKLDIRKKYGLKKNDVVAIYGGNFGRPQGLDFLLEVLKKYKNNSKVKFILIGRGTEKQKIFEEIDKNKYKNVLMYDYIKRDDYEKLSRACDFGLIFLDKRFTIPNYPSKTLSYCECSLPIMAATDDKTDYKDLFSEAEIGYWVLSGDIDSYVKKFDELINDENKRKEFGKNSYDYLVNNWNVDISVEILERFMGEK